jgi:2,3-bisphosphoglycerate-independent phosphoglycerate mutase
LAIQTNNPPNNAKIYRPLVLVILDGWGINAEIEGNAIANAKAPNYGQLKGNYPCIALQASGISVGLAWGEPGNSEVGHMTIGSGMILYQNLPRINLAIQNGTFFSNPVLIAAMDQAKRKGTALQLVGLVSNGGVHSHLDHLFALLELAASRGITKLFVHAITDGRDTSPKEGAEFITALQEKLTDLGLGKIASISGRNWPMDRNQNWDRVQKGYEAIIGTSKTTAKDPLETIRISYQRNLSDEYIESTTIVDEQGKPVGPVQEGDSVIFFNFREDRARQLTKAFVEENFTGFTRSNFIKNLEFITMVEYEAGLPVKVAFPPQKITSCLAKLISEYGKTQLHIAETEKYAHVTYFFNGGKEEAYFGEDRVLVPSPQVASYDLSPEMNAASVTEKILAGLQAQKYDFILVNYANADMIGHTGNFDAAVKAIEALDHCLGKLVTGTLAAGGALIITSDHGNAEIMIDPKTGEKITEHSSNPVPCFLITPDNKKERTETQLMRPQSMVDGMLVDIAPTVLELMGIPPSEEMVGNSLLHVLK